MPGAEDILFEINTQPAALVLSGNQNMVKATLKEIFNAWNENYTWSVFEEVPANWGLGFSITLPVSGPNKYVYFEKTGFGLLVPFYERPTGYTDTQWADYVVNKWNTEYVLGEYFIIRSSGSGIYIYGIGGAAINISSDTGVTVTRLIVATSVKSYNIINFTMRLYETYDLGGGHISYETLAEISLTPIVDDPDLYVEYDFHEPLYIEQNGHFTIFTQNSYYTLHSGLITKHIILFAITFENAETDYYRSIFTNEFFVLQGKISDFYQAQLNELSKSFYQYWLVDNKKFLTFAPTTKYIDIYQPEKLYMPDFTGIAYNINYKGYFENGQIITTQVLISNNFTRSMLEVNASFLGLPAFLYQDGGENFIIIIENLPVGNENYVTLDALRAVLEEETPASATVDEKENVVYIFDEDLTETDDGDLYIRPLWADSEPENPRPGTFVKYTITFSQVTKFDVWVTDSVETALSETRTYILDYKFQPFARYFLFKNKLNGYECVRTTGKLRVWSEIDKDFIIIDKEINYTTDYREEKQIDVTRKYVAELNSGFFVNDDLKHHFNELLESSDVYALKFGKAYPLVIEKGKYKYHDDDKKPEGKEFAFRIANPDDELYHDFTFDPDVPISGDFNFDFHEDFY